MLFLLVVLWYLNIYAWPQYIPCFFVCTSLLTPFISNSSLDGLGRVCWEFSLNLFSYGDLSRGYWFYSRKRIRFMDKTKALWGFTSLDSWLSFQPIDAHFTLNSIVHDWAKHFISTISYLTLLIHHFIVINVYYYVEKNTNEKWLEISVIKYSHAKTLKIWINEIYIWSPWLCEHFHLKHTIHLNRKHRWS